MIGTWKSTAGHIDLQMGMGDLRPTLLAGFSAGTFKSVEVWVVDDQTGAEKRFGDPITNCDSGRTTRRTAALPLPQAPHYRIRMRYSDNGCEGPATLIPTHDAERDTFGDPHDRVTHRDFHIPIDNGEQMAITIVLVDESVGPRV